MPDNSLQDWYAEGKAKGYLDRNPVLHDWVAEGVKKGYLKDLSGGSAPPPANTTDPEAMGAANDPNPIADISAPASHAQAASLTPKALRTGVQPVVPVLPAATAPTRKPTGMKKGQPVAPDYSTADRDNFFAAPLSSSVLAIEQAYNNAVKAPGGPTRATANTNPNTNYKPPRGLTVQPLTPEALAARAKPGALNQSTDPISNLLQTAGIVNTAAGKITSPVTASTANVVQGAIAPTLTGKGTNPAEMAKSALDSFLYNNGAGKIAKAVPQLGADRTEGVIYNAIVQAATNPFNFLAAAGHPGDIANPLQSDIEAAAARGSARTPTAAYAARAAVNQRNLTSVLLDPSHENFPATVKQVANTTVYQDAQGRFSPVETPGSKPVRIADLGGDVTPEAMQAAITKLSRPKIVAARGSGVRSVAGQLEDINQINAGKIAGAIRGSRGGVLPENIGGRTALRPPEPAAPPTAAAPIPETPAPPPAPVEAPPAPVQQAPPTAPENVPAPNPAPIAPVTPEPEPPATTFGTKGGTTPSPIITGARVTVHTPVSNTPIPTRYAVVDAGTLVPSNNPLTFAPTPGYDQAMQPRNLQEPAEQNKIITTIQNKLEPARLGASPTTADGAPIIGPDMHVESGNGRSIAILRNYAEGNPKADEYKATLLQHSGSFGIDPASIQHLQNPVLVRVRQGDTSDRAALAAQMGQEPTGRMSQTQTAQGDASRILQGNTLGLLNPTVDGSVSGGTNRDFIRAFNQSLPATELGSMMEGDALSTQGQERIQRALVTAAYGDTDLLKRLYSTTTDAPKGIATVLRAMAPTYAKLRAQMQQGNLHSADIGPDIAQAVNRLLHVASAKPDKLSVQQAVASDIAQSGMDFGDELSTHARMLLTMLSDHYSNQNYLRKFFQNYADAVQKAGAPGQQNLEGASTAPTVDRLLAQARTLTDGQTAKDATPDLFAAPAQEPAKPVQAQTVKPVQQPPTAPTTSTNTPKRGRRPQENTNATVARAQAEVKAKSAESRPLTEEEKKEYGRYRQLRDRALRRYSSLTTAMHNELSTLGEKYQRRYDREVSSRPKVLSSGTARAKSAKQVSTGELKATPSTGAGRIQAEPLNDATPAKPKAQITLDLSKGVGRRIDVAKQKGRGLGKYLPGSGSTQIAYQGDLSTTGHEIGHAIADKHNLLGEFIDQPTSPYDSELLDLSQYGSQPPAHLLKEESELSGLLSSGTMTPDQHARLAEVRQDILNYRRAEGVAEFFRANTLNPAAARAAAPRFWQYYQDTISKEDQDALRQFSDDVRRQVGLGPTPKVQSQIVSSEEAIKGSKPLARTVSALMRLLHGERDGLFHTSPQDMIRTKITDTEAPSITGFNEALKRTGRTVTPSSDFRILVRELPYITRRVNAMLEHGLRTDDGTRLSGPVANIFRALDTTSKKTILADLTLLGSFLVSRSALEHAANIDTEVDAEIAAKQDSLLTRVERQVKAFTRVQKKVGTAQVNGSTRVQLTRLAERAAAKIATTRARVEAAVKAEFRTRAEYLKANARTQERMVEQETSRRVQKLLSEEAKRLKIEYRAAEQVGKARAQAKVAGRGAQIAARVNAISSVRHASVESMIRTRIAEKRAIVNRTLKAGRITAKVAARRQLRLDFQEKNLRQRTGEITKQIEQSANWDATKEKGKLSALAATTAQRIIDAMISRAETNSAARTDAGETALIRSEPERIAKVQASAAKKSAALTARRATAEASGQAAVLKAQQVAQARAQKRGTEVISAAPAKLQRYIDRTVKTYQDNRLKAMANALARFEEKRRQSASDYKANLTGVGSGVEHDIDVHKDDIAAMDALKLSNPKKYAQIEQAADAYYNVSNGILDYLVDRNRIDAEDAADIKKRNAQHAYLQRVIDDSPIAPGHLKSTGVAAPKKTIFNFKGSVKRIDNPVSNLLAAFETAAKEGDRNRVMDKFTDVLGSERGYLDGEPTLLSDIGHRVEEGTKDAVKVFKKQMIKQADGSEKEKIVPTFWKFEDGISYAMNRLGKENLPPILGAFRWMARIKHNQIVRMIGFLIRNAIKDTGERLVKSRYAPLNRLGLIKGFKQEIANFVTPPTPEELESLAYFGAGIGPSHWLDSARTHHEVQDRMIESVLKENNKGKKNAVSLFRGAWEKYEHVVEMSERTNRLSEFRAVKQDPGVQKLAPVDQNRLAADVARTTGIDFMKGGEWTHVINQVIPFTRPTVTAHATFGTWLRDAVRDKDYGALTRVLFRAALAAIIPLAYAAGHGGQEGLKEFFDQAPYVHDFFYNFKVAPNRVLSIPKDHDTALLTAGMTRAIGYEMGYKDAFDGYGMDIVNNLLPVDQAALIGGPMAPIVEGLTNYDAFRQRNIVPPYENSLALDLRRGTRYASRIGKVGQKLTGIDARKIDAGLANEFGDTARIAQMISDFGRADKINPVPRIASTLTGIFRESPGYDSLSVQKGLQDSALSGSSLMNPRSKDYPLPAIVMNRMMGASSDKEADKAKREARAVFSGSVVAGINQRARDAKLRTNRIVDQVLKGVQKSGAPMTTQKQIEAAARDQMRKK